MNILFLNSKIAWGGVVSWQVQIARGLEKRSHRAWFLSGYRSALTQNAPADLRLVPCSIGMDFNPRLILGLVRFIKKNRIDLVATNIKKELMAGGIAARICGIPSVRFIGNERDFDRIQRLQLSLVDGNVAPCKATRNLIRESYPWVPETSLKVIPIGRDTAHFSGEEIAGQRGAWGLTRDDRIIGVTGRLVREKGVGTLIEAFSKIPPDPRLYLVIAGTGKDESEFRALAKALGLEGKVIFAGFVENPQLAAAAYDIAVLPSFEEAFPCTLVEYMSVGAAVVATAVGGTPEIVKNGANGFLVEPGNVNPLTEKLALLLRDETLRRQFGRLAMGTVNRHFSEDLMAEQCIAYFGSLIRS